MSEVDQLLMRRMDELHTEFPFAGARMPARLLRREGHEVGRRRVRTLMKRMGVEPLYCKPNTSRRNTQHKIWPYLLRSMKIEHANEVFALDTTYIPVARGFVYLTAVVNWANRKVLAHRVAITLEAAHAVEALEVAFARYGPPDIVNTDQGSQFTAGAFTEAVLSCGMRLSMDGKGSWRDNGFVERVWRSIEYEEVYLKAYESVSHARRFVGEYINLYNRKRPHLSLADQTPERHISRRCLRLNRQHDCLGRSTSTSRNTVRTSETTSTQRCSNSCKRLTRIPVGITSVGSSCHMVP